MATSEVGIKATRDSLAQIVKAEPKKHSQAELGRRLGVSRQRVHEIVKAPDLHQLVRPKQWSFHCLDCGKPIHGGTRCRQCWLKIWGAKRVTLSCDFCGKKFERKESEARRHILHFCSTSCRGSYNGVWQAHGEEIKQLVGQGVSMVEIGRRFGVSRERIRVLLKKHNLPNRAPMLKFKKRLLELLMREVEVGGAGKG